MEAPFLKYTHVRREFVNHILAIKIPVQKWRSSLLLSFLWPRQITGPQWFWKWAGPSWKEENQDYSNWSNEHPQLLFVYFNFLTKCRVSEFYDAICAPSLLFLLVRVPHSTYYSLLLASDNFVVSSLLLPQTCIHDHPCIQLPSWEFPGECTQNGGCWVLGYLASPAMMRHIRGLFLCFLKKLSVSVGRSLSPE